MTRAQPRYFECFTDKPGGGNFVAIVSNAADLRGDAMQSVATQIGAPATCFLGHIEGNRVHARFFSPRSEYKMCGHAVIGLFTMLLKDGLITEQPRISLITPEGIAPVYVESDGHSHRRIMVDIQVPRFQRPGPGATEISRVLKIPLDEFSSEFPLEVAVRDFTHLLIPLKARAHLSKLAPSFADIAEFCRTSSIESIALLTLPTLNVHNTYEIREFCPAIGVDESAAAGTTNASVSCYLARHGALTRCANDLARTKAHQGAAVGRPSVIHSEVRYTTEHINSVRTGGVAIEASELS